MDKQPSKGCPNCDSLAAEISPVGFSTAMATHTFTDEQGRLHYHDPNTHTTHLQCRACLTEYTQTTINACWCQLEAAAAAARSQSEPRSGDVLTWDGSKRVYRSNG